MSATELNDFERLVWEMRCRQLQYFKRPIPPRLIAAKEAEKKVDAALDAKLGQAQVEFDFQVPADEIPY
jgi:hypothetical protein